MFAEIVWDYYHSHGRNLPWRQGRLDPYTIMVSEVMLQQTQVPRVIEKYKQFLELFPTVQSLAAAPLSDVLFVWQGLGYNRRGRFLREAAVKIMNDYTGVMPRTVAELVTLPGIGHNTASAIAVYAYNQPLVFIETNIRTVYLHHFFADQESVPDTQILEKVAATVDPENPREWYWALMDYGSYLKKEFGNPNVRSKHYTKQSKFQGSNRQLRGQLLRDLALGERPENELKEQYNDARFDAVVAALINEKLIERHVTMLRIAQ